MDNYYDDIMLEYELFLAEQELYDNLISLGSQVYHEDYGLILLKEDYNNKVNGYIDKIVKGLQKAWNTFKEKVVDADIKPYLNSIKDKYTKWSSEQHEIILENFHTYNWATFDTINVVPYDQEKLNVAKTKEEYYKSVYSSFYTDPSKSLKENIIDKVMDTQAQHKVTSQDVTNAFTFCTQEFLAKVNKVKNDLVNFNSQIEVLKNAINVTANNGEEVSGAAPQAALPAPNSSAENESATVLSLYESCCILLEDDNKNELAVRVASNTNNDNNGTKTGDDNNVKKMTIYITGNVDVMSAKMKILRRALSESIASILKQALPPRKDNNDQETVQQPVQATQTQQVQIGELPG